MNILDSIIADTGERVRQSRAIATPELLTTLPGFHAPTLSLRKAVIRQDVAVIAEIKKASPSKGVIRPDFDVAQLAQAYRRGRATAVSVLTEPSRFSGSLTHLAEVRRFLDLPVLRKDFIIDPYQLVESRAYGADAILLIVAALSKDQFAELLSGAHELGLECLVEVHSEKELKGIDLDKIDLLGVNNRDLATFDVDLGTTARVLSTVPDHIPVISESGISTARQMADLAGLGVAGYLIGERLMRARDAGSELNQLISETEQLTKSSRALRLAC